MKNLLIITLLLTAIQANSQSWKLGIMASPQFIWLQPSGTDKIVNEGGKLNFDIGLTVERKFTKHYGFLTGVFLNNVGGKMSYDKDLLDITLDGDLYPSIDSGTVMNTSMQYLKMPFALKFRTNEIGYFTYFAQIGIEAGVNLKSLVSISDYDLDKVKFKDYTIPFEAGYMIGAGLEYSLGGNTSLIAGLQYKTGFIPVFNTDLTEEKRKLLQSKISLIVGILF